MLKRVAGWIGGQAGERQGPPPCAMMPQPVLGSMARGQRIRFLTDDNLVSAVYWDDAGAHGVAVTTEDQYRAAVTHGQAPRTILVPRQRLVGNVFRTAAAS